MIGNQVICCCILLWSQNLSKRVTFQFHNIFFFIHFSKLSVCEISCVKQESNTTSKMFEPFFHPYEEIEQQIQRERKAIRSIGKAEKSCHNGLIYFLKSYFYFQTPLLSYLIFYKLIFIFFSASKPFSFTI